MFCPFTHKEVYEKSGFFRSSRMASVIIGDGLCSFINDLSFSHEDSNIQSLNSFVDAEDFENF